MFQNVIADFAKTNKVSRAKVEAYTAAIVASIPKARRKETSGRIGRPVLDKTRALHESIIEAVNRAQEIENGSIPKLFELNLQRDAASIRKHLGEDKITFNNAVNALVKQGKIYHAGKAKTGTRGRQPYILSTFPPAPEVQCFVL